MAKIQDNIRRTIRNYKLLTKKDKILVACSGGKDSTVVLYLLKKLGYDAYAFNINNGSAYDRQNIKNLENFCKKYNIKLYKTSLKKEFNYSLASILNILKSKKIKLNPCTICGVLRRYLLNKFAYKIKATKVVTGHNMDDEAQSILMNLFRANIQFSARLGPVSGIIKNKRFIPRIKPLYFVSEKEIAEFSRKMRFRINYSRCPFVINSFRNKIRQLLNDYEKRHPGTKKQIIINFIKHKNQLKKFYAFNGPDKKISYCRICGQPSRRQICNSCHIIRMLRKV